jgi:hypothetical protein
MSVQKFDKMLIIQIMITLQNKFRGMLPSDKQSIVDYLNGENDTESANIVAAISDAAWKTVVSRYRIQ